MTQTELKEISNILKIHMTPRKAHEILQEITEACGEQHILNASHEISRS